MTNLTPYDTGGSNDDEVERLQKAFNVALNLTPYDTGERLQPHLHVVPTAKGSWAVNSSNEGIAQARDEQFGKVDFEDANGDTLFIVHIERTPTGYAMKVFPNWFDGDFTFDFTT